MLELEWLLTHQQSMSARNQIGYTNIPRIGALPTLATPPRRYNFRSSTASKQPESEVQAADSSSTSVWECYLPVSREVWRFPGHLGEHRRRIEELEGAWFAQGDKIIGLDCDDVLVMDD